MARRVGYCIFLRMVPWTDRKRPYRPRTRTFARGPTLCLISADNQAYVKAARFVKESSLQKRGQLLPDIDMMASFCFCVMVVLSSARKRNKRQDCHVRQENLNIRGDPIMLQLSLVPAYALTVHKTQALSIKHLVLGCLEGCFAIGHVYVLVSRVPTGRF